MLVCEEVGYELSPARGWGGGKALIEEEATDCIRRLAANAGTLCYEAVGVSVDNLKGVEWLNGVAREAREGCVRLNMQVEADVKTIRGIWRAQSVCGYKWMLVEAGRLLVTPR